MIGGGVISEFNFSKAWGVNPAAATGKVIMNVVGGAGSVFGLKVGDYVTYSFGSVASFPGVVSEVSVATEFGSGNTQTFQVVDNRVRLGWQMVFGAWNIEDDTFSKFLPRPVADPADTMMSVANGADGVDGASALPDRIPPVSPPAATPVEAAWAVRRRFRHLLPQHWESGVWTYTDEPYTAKEVLESAFNNAWGDFRFTRDYHASLSTAIVTGLDHSSGTKLSSLIGQINSSVGLEVYLSGARALKWGIKGVGPLPVPDGSCAPLAAGSALTSADTKLRVVGERMRIQKLNIELEPDWNPRYEIYLDELAWLNKVAELYEMPTATKADEADLAAFARRVTVDEFAKKEESVSWLDARPFGKAARNQLPVWVYIRELLYRSYRIPEDYVLYGVPLASLDFADSLLCSTKVGAGEDNLDKQNYDDDPVQYYPSAQAQAICQGQPLDLLNARDIRLFYRNASTGFRDEWTDAPAFDVDGIGKSIRFHVCTFIDGDPTAGTSLYIMENRGEAGGTDLAASLGADSDYLDVAVPNPDFSILPAKIKASFCFMFGRFYRDYGKGPRRGVVSASGLDLHLCEVDENVTLDDAGAVNFDDADVRLPAVDEAQFKEVLYQDGVGAIAKADAVAGPVLELSAVQHSGGFTRNGVAGTSLSPVIDRITVAIAFGSAVTERVDYTKARASSVAFAERTLQRLQRTEELFTGQDALKREIRQYRALATLEREGKSRLRSRTHTTFTDVFEKPVGSEHTSSRRVVDRAGAAAPGGGWKAGDLVWLDTAGLPAKNGGVFGGVVVATPPTAGTGANVFLTLAFVGKVPVRLNGPLAVNGMVMVTPGARMAGGTGPLAIGLLSHGKSVPVFSSGILAYVDLSPSDPICRFRVKFDGPEGRLYCGPGTTAWPHPDDPDEIVVPTVPTLDGTPLSSLPWWNLASYEVGTEYQVICIYADGVSRVVLKKPYVALSPALTAYERAMEIARVQFDVSGDAFKLAFLHQTWGSDIVRPPPLLAEGGVGIGNLNLTLAVNYAHPMVGWAGTVYDVSLYWRNGHFVGKVWPGLDPVGTITAYAQGEGS